MSWKAKIKPFLVLWSKLAEPATSGTLCIVIIWIFHIKIPSVPEVDSSLSDLLHSTNNTGQRLICVSTVY